MELGRKLLKTAEKLTVGNLFISGCRKPTISVDFRKAIFLSGKKRTKLYMMQQSRIKTCAVRTSPPLQCHHSRCRRAYPGRPPPGPARSSSHHSKRQGPPLTSHLLPPPC